MQSKNYPTDFDILIVGSGMVGAALGCALANRNLRIGLLDGVVVDTSDIPASNEQVNFDSRVSAIAPASRLFFESLEVWDGISASRHCPFSEMHVWDADGTGSIHFSAADIHQPELGYIIENSVVLGNLHRQLQRHADISLIAPAKVQNLLRNANAQNSGIRIVTDAGRELSASLLIGADGPSSTVRQLAGFKTREWDYQQQALVTTVRTELPHSSTALQRFMDSGPLAFLPLATSGTVESEQHYCSIVWSLVEERAEALLALSDEDFASALQSAIESRLGRVEWVDRRQAFELRQRHAVDYVQENIALLGDAAHTIHPLAGQGVNLGLLDAQVLAEEIIANLQRGRAINEMSMLRRYQRRRKGHNLGMMGLMEGFKHLFAGQALPLRWLRNTGMRGVDNLPLLKNYLMRQAMGV
jgi:2-polyprenylphenol 6-hydroxylase